MKVLVLFSIMLFPVSVISQGIDSEMEKGIELLKEKDWEGSLDIFLDIIDADENNAEAHYHAAYSYFALGDLDEAIEYSERSVELVDDSAKYHFRLGELYGIDAMDASIFRAPGLAGDIKEQFERTIELDPSHVGGQMALAQFYFQAPGIVGGDTEKAIEHAQIAATLDEKQGRLLLARIYESEERIEEAEKELQFLETNYGDDADFYFLYDVYGYFLMNQERIDEAIVKFKKQVDLAPDRHNPYDSLGEAYRKKGMLKEALVSYKKALEINPEYQSSIDAVEEIEDELE